MQLLRVRRKAASLDAERVVSGVCDHIGELLVPCYRAGSCFLVSTPLQSHESSLMSLQQLLCFQVVDHQRSALINDSELFPIAYR